MKWPKTITLIRHGQSEYNILKKKKMKDPDYQRFMKLYESDFDALETKDLAIILWKRYKLNHNDAETPLTEIGYWQAEQTGAKLKGLINLPDVVLVSPYLRTWQTQWGLAKGWPELTTVKIYEDERIREQEHGLATLYNDWRIFHVMHPEQKFFYEMQGPYRYTYPQGENVPRVRMRNMLFTNTLIREYAGEDVLVITHHLNILAQRANYERLTEAQFKDLDINNKPFNCGITIYECDPNLGKAGKLILKKYNEKLYPTQTPCL